MSLSPKLRYVGSRLVTTLLVLLCATILLFGLTLLIPGNPAEVLLGPRATPETVQAYSHAMGLDRPLLQRLLIFLGNVLRGDLGRDVISGRPVLDLVLEVFPYTLTLTLAAIGLAVVLGVPLGCYAATHPGSWFDQVGAVTSVAFIAMPNFVVAVFLVLIFSVWLHWLPVLGVGRGGGWGDAALRLILPALSLALSWIGYIARLLRASLLEVLGEAHIRTARAYGVPERRIVYRNALKLAAIPTVAILGLGVGRLLGGAIFAEIVFARPGLGTLVYDAIAVRNYPVVQATVLVVVGVFTLTNLLTDLSYLWLDPRLGRRLGEGR
ncbi:MAG TPA: ABC transporter permease [Aliidongia sp.]|uniref:ABC transporter permease n=1 Tax=Aliidongia sp. TaxID=1914230 RepID=UPI002DDCD80A|nr:ABC transporter permease [Aliidongia sp.]HEV2676129.1 ABC transporter permease [Aliidongia sp.]